MTKFMGADVCKWLRWVCLALVILIFASCVYGVCKKMKIC